MKYVKLCLAVSKGNDIPPFYFAYACEALASAEMKAKNLKNSLAAAEKIVNEEHKGWVLSDLKRLK